MTQSLFDESPAPYDAPEAIAPGAVVLRGFARDTAETLIQSIDQVIATAPLRRFITPGGRAMSVAGTVNLLSLDGS